MLKTKDYIIIGLVLIALLGIGYFGFTLYPRFNPCPEQYVDTLYIYDTVEHHIPDTVPFYIVKKDTVIYRDTVFKDVDTAEILKDYFALHAYVRLWWDSTLKVTLLDTISQNKPQGNTFVYKILKPQVVNNNVTNTYSYSRYVTMGLSTLLKDLTYTGVELDYISPQWYGGVGYNIGMKGITIRAGGTIKKFK